MCDSVKVTFNDDGDKVVTIKCPQCNKDHTRVVGKECTRLSICCSDIPGTGHIDIWLDLPKVKTDPNAPKVEIPSLREFIMKTIPMERIHPVQPMALPGRDFMRHAFKRFAEKVNETSNTDAT
jgi:hypothetical protein